MDSEKYFDEGKQAWWDDLEQTDNPYDEGTVEHTEWDHGWFYLYDLDLACSYGY